MTYQEIFDRLWAAYTSQNPSTQKVFDLFTSEGETVINDHIAFRTFRHPEIGVDRFARVFLENGYRFAGEYRFQAKKLFARHYEHETDGTAPRVFISELLTEEFSPWLQETVSSWIDRIPARMIRSDELIFAGNLSGTPSYEVYERLRTESEYAAWLYVNGFRANHFTVSVNHLHKYGSVNQVNDFLKSHGFLINDAGGEIQGTPQDLLEQSSIKAGMTPFEFREGVYEIPGCYYEFARRYPDTDGKLYSGFIARSADKIFESTNFYKK
ncbi:MAG TPA: DUF1338 domain-containing protein [Bacteroidales bacterium]|nr:DUF1338 domain-containing protein [Bacteroidales bacterium]